MPAVTQDQIDFFQENGFVQINDIITQEELQELRQYMDELMNVEGGLAPSTSEKGSSYYRVLNQRVNGWRDHALFGKFSFHPRFAEAAMLLTGSNGMRFFHDHSLLKMPEDSKPTPWHQDFPYWPMDTKGENTLSIWIALDDVDENNGCMKFLPKSHKKAGKLNPIDLVGEPVDVYEYVKGTGLEQEKTVIARMKAGSCTFHSGLTFHYAHANNTNKPRRALAIVYYPDGTLYDGKAHIVTDGLGMQIGEPLAGRLCPLLATR